VGAQPGETIIKFDDQPLVKTCTWRLAGAEL